MWLIVGLGNPGMQYEQTRHNMGYLAVDELSKLWRLPITGEKMHGYFASGRAAGQAVALLKPTTYMNDSGRSVAEAMGKLRVGMDELIVLYDDLDLPVGKLRIRGKGGPGTHNGMKSIIYETGAEDFARVRIGIGAVPPNTDIIDFVLGKPQIEELELLQAACKRAAEAVDAIVRLGVEPAMQRFNKG